MTVRIKQLPHREYQRKADRIHKRRDGGPKLFPPYHLKSNRWFKHLFAITKAVYLIRLTKRLYRRMWWRSERR